MFQIKNEAQRATVYLYGTIGADFWDEDSSNTAKTFAATLDSLSPKPLDIRVDSCGGDVYEGFAIASAVQRYEGDTTCYIDGIAASAASYVALMADRVVMNDYSQIMIHNAWTWCSGNSAELLEMAGRLDALDGTIAGIIAARSGMELDAVREAMAAETWYSADDAVANGLADEVVKTEHRMAASIDRAMLAAFKHVPNGLEEKSHAANTIQNDEGHGRSVVMGNRIYRVER